MTDSIYRCSNHTLRWNTKIKNTELQNLFEIYKQELERCICELLKLDSIPKMGSIESDIIKHSAWKQIIFANASEIIRRQIKKASNKRYKTYQKIFAKAKEFGKFQWFTEKKFSELNLKPIHKTRFFKKPDLKSVSITLDSRICNIKSDSKHFDGFLKISLPFLKDGSKRYQSIRLPFKHHKHSLKFKDWKQKKSVGLRITETSIHLIFFYEKEKPTLKTKGISLGLDIGYKKLLTLSNGMFYGTKDLEYLYNYISKKKRGSKRYKKSIKHKQDEINRYINLFLRQHPDLKILVVENLKSLKSDSKFSHNFNNKLQYWSYRQVLEKLERFCEENGILLIRINPAYTSQTCSHCGERHKESRKGELFKCLSCGYEIDADLNASINIHSRGLLTTLSTEESPCL